MVEKFERETGKEKLFEMACERMYENAKSTGFLGRVIGFSAHADKTEQGAENSYDKVDFCGYFGAGSLRGGILAQPVFMHKEGGHQAVTPKLYRLETDVKKKEELVASLWDGVTEEDKKAIISRVLQQLEGSSLLYGERGESNRRALDGIRRGLDDEVLDVSIDPELGALVVRLKAEAR